MLCLKIYNPYKLRLARLPLNKNCGSRVINIKKIQSDKGSFFYLVLVGNYQNINQAKAICKKLSDNQQGCIITNR